VEARIDLPTGTVTLLLTDVAGSTSLLHVLGDGYAAVLATHHALLRDAFRARGGVEVDSEGDAFFFAFPDAAAGLFAAADGQRALAAHAWPGGRGMRVRMGLHTGTPIRTDEGYVGIDLHQAARLMAAAAGGQVVTSAATAALLANVELESLFLIDLGEHLLKDFGVPQRVYQLAGPGLEGQFPPLRTLSSRFANIPTLAGPLIGREDEVALVVGLFDGEGERLVTLTGPGGTGKTSLALRAAAELLDRMADGVVFCDLAPIADSTLLPSGIARALGLRESGGMPTVDVITAFVGQKQLLLILDNLEQLLDGVAVISHLLDACPQLSVLATSRAPLRLAAEREQPVDPLIPADALELLTVRARRADPRFSLEGSLRDQAITLCARLDSLPLAIELAAARLRLFSLPELLNRLDSRLSLLTGGRRDAPARQQTLRATLDWSFGLLDAAEQQTLARTAVFVGGFSAEAAEIVCGATLDEIAGLVEQNLVRSHDGRLTLLETIRDYGLERLAESGEEQAVRGRHADWFVRLSERAGPELSGTDQVAWFDRLELELDNLLAALAFLVESKDANEALRLTSSIWVFWETRRAAEGRRALKTSLENRAGADAHLAAQAMLASGTLLFWDADMQGARPYFEAGARVFRELGDDTWLAPALVRLSWVALETDKNEEALELAGEALDVVERVIEPWARAEVLNYAGCALVMGGGDRRRGRALLEQAHAEYREMGNEQRVGEVLNNLGWVVMHDGEFDLARSYHARNIVTARRTRDGSRLSHALGNLAVIAALTGQLTEARAFVLENLAVQRERGERRNVGEALIVAAAILASSSDHEAAHRLVGAAEAMYQAGGADLNEFERRILDERVFAAMENGGREALFHARAAGRAMTTYEAIDFALEALSD
jgi:predicted ATPase